MLSPFVRIARGALPALVLAATGCAVLSGPDCIQEYRGVSAAAHLVDLTTASADTGRAFLSLSHVRNARTSRQRPAVLSILRRAPCRGHP